MSPNESDHHSQRFEPSGALQVAQRSARGRELSRTREWGNHRPGLAIRGPSLSSGPGSVPWRATPGVSSVPVSRSSWPRGGHGGTRRAPTIARSTTLAGLRASSERIAGCIARASRNSMARCFLESPQKKRIAARASSSAGFPLMWNRWTERDNPNELCDPKSDAGGPAVTGPPYRPIRLAAGDALDVTPGLAGLRR